METASHVFAERNTQTVRQICRCVEILDKSDGDVLANICKFVLWPDCTAAHLAAAIGKVLGKPFSVRQAERYLAGKEWSGAAVEVVFNEILERRRVRNLKVRAK